MYSSPEYTTLTPCHHSNSPAAAKSLSVEQRRPLFELHWCCWWIFKLHCICISTLVLDCLCIPGQNFWCISEYSIDAMLIFCICICIIALNCILCPLYFQTLSLQCQRQLSNIIILSPIDSLCNTGMVEVYFVLWWSKLWFWTFCCVLCSYYIIHTVYTPSPVMHPGFRPDMWRHLFSPPWHQPPLFLPDTLFSTQH